MKDYIFYLLIIGVCIMILPYIRWILKRIVMLIKLKSYCKAHNYSIRGTHILWFFGSNSAKPCDLYIENDSTVYAIKLFGVRRKRIFLHFNKNRSFYFEKPRVLFNSWGWAYYFSLDSKSHMLNEYDFQYKYDNEWNGKKHIPILLLNPTCIEVKIEDKILGDGDSVFDMQIYSLSGFLKRLENKN